MFTLQANSPTAVLLTLNDKLVNVSIHVDSDVKKRVKNKLCFILCQDIAFVSFKELVIKVTVLNANVYLSTCGSLSSVQ
jgi:hypothetical protein